MMKIPMTECKIIKHFSEFLPLDTHYVTLFPARDSFRCFSALVSASEKTVETKAEKTGTA